MKYRLIRIAAALSLALLALPLAGCLETLTGPPQQDVSQRALVVGDTTGTITIVGRISYLDLEGGFWALFGDDGNNYDPMNLPEAFEQEDLRVRVQALIRDDIANFHMFGTIIEIRSIEAL